MVVATLQYRLGVFGFLGGEALRNRSADGSAGNYGMLDQRLALSWLRRHVAAFGGDPGRICLFGQSAGAASVNFHVVSRSSRGLFASAAMQSGANGYWAAQELAVAEESLRRTLAMAGCSAPRPGVASSSSTRNA